MKKLIFLFAMCMTLVGCSNENKTSNDILSNATEFNFTQAFEFKKEKSVTLLVEKYENGQRKEEKLT